VSRHRTVRTGSSIVDCTSRFVQPRGPSYRSIFVPKLVPGPSNFGPPPTRSSAAPVAGFAARLRDSDGTDDRDVPVLDASPPPQRCAVAEWVVAIRNES
jgi:hypothetical protein